MQAAKEIDNMKKMTNRKKNKKLSGKRRSKTGAKILSEGKLESDGPQIFEHNQSYSARDNKEVRSQSYRR
jgi:hypothetical protein